MCFFWGDYRRAYKYKCKILRTIVKKVLRSFLQKTFKIRYSHPPFTKCPKCGYEIFNKTNTFNDRKITLHVRKWREFPKVLDSFGVLFDKARKPIKINKF